MFSEYLTSSIRKDIPAVHCQSQMLLRLFQIPTGVNSIIATPLDLNKLNSGNNTEDTIMARDLEKIIDNLDKLKIGIDDTFKFHCDQCGKCCIHRDDILLNPKDVFKIAKKFGTDPIEIIKTYCETYIGSDSKMPIVRLLPKGTVQRCPFLKDRKCSIHEVKPTVCATFPLGRIITYSVEAAEQKELTPGKVQYIFNNPRCGDDSETHTVREWLSDFDIESEDEFFLKWNKFLTSVGLFMRTAEKRFLEKRLNQIYDMIFGLLYCSYDISKDFMQQFESNKMALEMFLKQHGYKKEA